MQFNPVKLTCGIPQDSVLGPVLFTLYTTPLASITTCHHLNHHFYADDIQLFNSALPKLDDTNKLQQSSEKTENSSEQDKNCPPFLSTPFSLIPQSLSLTLSKASVFSLTAHCPWRASSVKPPNQLCRISFVRKYLSTEATVKLATSHSVTPGLLQFSPFWPACFLCPEPS